MLLSLCALCGYLGSVAASVTVYGQIPLADATTSSASASGTSTALDSTTTVAAAYNTTVLNPPAIPANQTTAFSLALLPSNTSVSGLSIVQPGAFWGFSVEMSVVTQVLGKNSSFLQVQFLNLMSLLEARSGRVNVRVGGNTQEFAWFVDDISTGAVIAKESIDATNPTATPNLIYDIGFFYLLGNISSLVNVKWYLGIPFNDTSDFRLEILEYGQSILGDNLLGFQAGNEPDLYADHGHRNSSYDPQTYSNEIGLLIEAIEADTAIPYQHNLIGPSVSGTWSPQQVWDTGFITEYSDNLAALAVEIYPDNNCFAEYGIGQYKDLDLTFANYLNHTSGQIICDQYLSSTALAVAANKPFLMFETNTASCGGFAGISDSFGAALWALDYGLQMAYSNFSGAMLHVGGQNVFYSPFTPPPTNESSYHQWTIGAVFYSALVVAEAFGSSNTSQIIDLQGNDGNIYTPQYAIYENGALAKVALFNYVTDPTGATDYTVTLSVGGGETGVASAMPASVKVKYLLSESVSTKDNITWAGQTLGTQYTVDGRLQGDLNIVTINCDQTANTCAIPVPAPAFALVFFTDDVFEEASPTGVSTYATTTQTKTANTATIDASVLATSNGHSGSDRQKLGSTSSGSVSGAIASRGVVPTVFSLLVVAAVTLTFRDR